MSVSKESRAQQTWDGLIQKRKRVDILLEGQEVATKNETKNEARAALLIDGDPTLERKERKVFQAQTQTLAGRHAKDHPDSDNAFASQGSESEAPPMDTTGQPRVHRNERRRSRSKVARHPQRGDQEDASQADGESPEDEGATRTRGKSSKWQGTGVANGRSTEHGRPSN